jgi:hypothetical protein
MKLRAFQSIPEALLYFLLVFAIAGNIFFIVSIYHLEQLNQQSTKQIEKQMVCIGAFFLQNNRSELTLHNLNVCQPIVDQVH